MTTGTRLVDVPGKGKHLKVSKINSSYKDLHAGTKAVAAKAFKVGVPFGSVSAVKMSISWLITPTGG